MEARISSSICSQDRQFKQALCMEVKVLETWEQITSLGSSALAHGAVRCYSLKRPFRSSSSTMFLSSRVFFFTSLLKG